MAFKNRLLATAAIPLMALMGLGSVSAAGLPSPNLQVQTQSLVVPAQADDQELLQQQKKKERQERRENRQKQNQSNNDQGNQDDQGNNNRKRKNQQDDAGAQQQDNGQEVQQPRKKKQQQNDDVQQTQQDDQQQMTPRKKKQNAEVQQIQQDDQQQVTPRRKKQNDDVQQTQQDDQQQMAPRKKRQNADSGAQQDDMNGVQVDDQQQVKPRRKNQNDNAATDQGQSADDKLKNAIDNTNKRHKKNQNQANDNQADQPKDNNNGSIEVIQTNKKPQADEVDNGKPRRKNDTPVDVKKATDIAADPAKTTDTVVLPVENGAAVLDSDKDADKRGADRNRRKREREDIKQVAAPKSDKDAQRGFRDEDRIRFRPVLEDKGQRIPGFKGYDDVGGRRIGDRGDRVVINIGGRLVIRTDDDRRLARNTGITYEQLDRNMVREVIVRPNGDRIVTVRNRYGEIVRRSRIVGKREVVIIYSPELERGRDRLFLRDPGDNLPPMRLRIPVKDYIIDVSGGGASRNYEEFLDEPPVEPVERVYSVGEVTTSARIRDKMRRIDLDTITFETGSADIDQNQVPSLKRVGAAIKAIIDKDPGETFLIEGHTDAVGSDESNLVLSDSRAESIASVLTDAFGIPAENLVTKGYGEQYLKIDTDGPERANRRVTIRRITPLVRPLATSEQ